MLVACQARTRAFALLIGAEKLGKELDLKRLLNRLNAFEALLGAMADDKDRLFLAFNKHLVISSGEEGGSMSSDNNDYFLNDDKTEQR